MPTINEWVNAVGRTYKTRAGKFVEIMGVSQTSVKGLVIGGDGRERKFTLRNGLCDEDSSLDLMEMVRTTNIPKDPLSA
jgi:hypothetical protein